MDRYGVDMITRIEMLPAALFPTEIRQEGSAHPRFSSMAVSKRSFSQEAAGTFYRMTYLYEGFLLSIPSPTYELNGSVGEDPIQLHRDFVESLAGTPSAPLNGANFIDPETGKISSDDDVGVFDRFGEGELAGVEAYRVPTAVWTEISFSGTRPTGLGDLGTKEAPNGPNPSFGEGRNWMFVGATYRKRGHIFEIRKSWELSGRGGWNDLIY